MQPTIDNLGDGSLTMDVLVDRSPAADVLGDLSPTADSVGEASPVMDTLADGSSGVVTTIQYGMINGSPSVDGFGDRSPTAGTNSSPTMEVAATVDPVVLCGGNGKLIPPDLFHHTQVGTLPVHPSNTDLCHVQSSDGQFACFNCVFKPHNFM